MKKDTAAVVICGAGMAGVASAYHLAVKCGVRGVVLVDEREPLTLTSDKGTEAYRNWWPDAAMLRFMNRSIDLLEELAEESGNAFELNRRGYVFLTAEQSRAAAMRQTAGRICRLGAGELREHPGPAPYEPAPGEGHRASRGSPPTGADLVLDPELIQRQFPFVAADVAAMLHVRRCGWLNARRLGGWLLERAIGRGVRLARDRVAGVEIAGGRVAGVRLESGGTIGTEALVIAAGPYLKRVGAMLGLDLPVFCELHGKMALEDRLGVVPRDAPLMIWNDPVRLEWSEPERQALAEQDDTRWMLGELPAGVHFRPRTRDGRAELLMIWTYDVRPQEPVFPPRFSAYYSEVLLRGLARMIPGLKAYFGESGAGRVDGGYYCKTRENRPLVGPLPVGGAFVIGALSGFGVMGSQAAAELLAAHLTGGELPEYAAAFRLSRYDDPEYRKRLPEMEALGGQL